MRSVLLGLRIPALVVVCLAGLTGGPPVHELAAQTPPAIGPALFADLRWRNIGPHRASRTKALDGVPEQPHTFYIGVVNGGVWKTTDAGRSWNPIFDEQPTGSIGALAVAPSDPNVVYVGTGEGQQRPDLATGDGMYKSTDAGRTWTHLGLRDTQQIAQVVVDPTNSERLFVAALGHPYGPNAERGIFRSLDGGRTFERLLYRDEDTGGADVLIDPATPSTVYASLWQARQGPWENADFRGPGSGLFKSTDGGATWRRLSAGLPTWEADRLGRIGIGIAPSQPSRLYLVVAAGSKSGIYRSDDAGEQWTLVNSDARVVARPYDATDIRVHPSNPDIVIVPTVVTWKSIDGGHTFDAIRGAPGGDDYQRAWFNPAHPDIIALTSDQGAIISLNGGATWSSWYNQPTAAFYHVTTDNAFPYRVCSGQQESGSACVASRGDHGQITFRDWSPVGVEEYGYVAPDPLDPDIVYGGKVSRWDRRTGQVQNVGPKPVRDAGYRVVRTMPILFSPVNPRKLYFASNALWETTSGGAAWTSISPDLTRTTWPVPPSVGIYANMPDARPAQRGVIYTIAPSPLDERVIWIGTDDGLIHRTTDGGATWADVTPSTLGPWMKVSLMDASHFDVGTAYAAVNTFRLDDLRPHVYRTRDGGRTWTHITAGLPDGAVTNVVREDPQQRGLLYAGTEQEVYVSFDDGERWHSLRINMPATSIRDLVVKDDDLVVGTHGRSFWILDDISPLRQLPGALSAGPRLLTPRTATRVRWNMGTDTPLPPDEPAGENPPDGATLHYWLPSNAGEVTLEILDTGGSVVRRYSSSDPPDPLVEGRNTPDYWIRPSRPLSAARGLHRFVWDLHHERPAAPSFSYPIAAIVHNTPRTPLGSWVLPGTYTVRLAVDGRSQSVPLQVRLDPRVKTPSEGLRRQYDLSRALDGAMRRAGEALATARASGAAARMPELQGVLGTLVQLYGMVEAADVEPTGQLASAAREAITALDRVAGRP
ncbi:MAG: glycoside hydrolase [Acidobacteria bacterium]|nr:glycoside hydrolase [Acidobacteriota bacterium]